MIEERNIVETLKVDCVDSIIVTLATSIFNECGFEKPLPIATWDTRDFYRLGEREDIRTRLYDLREDLIQDLGQCGKKMWLQPT